MSSTLRYMRQWRSTFNRGKLMSGSLATFATAVVGWKSLAKSEEGKNTKDKIVFLSKAENATPSTAKIMTKVTGENRDPLLPNGDLNWACDCIERDVVGPCNVKFRILRQFIHDIHYNHKNLPAEKKAEMDRVMEDYLFCTFDHLKYYEDRLTEEEKAEEAEWLKQEEEKDEIERKKKASRRRDFGKDKVLILTREENAIPSKAKIPSVVTEEERGPLLPNGDVNWACTCIEREVIGPCNIQFRAFRQFVHDNKTDPADLPEEKQMELHHIIRSFLDCTRNNPVYYRDFIKDDEDQSDSSGKGDDSGKESDQNSGTNNEDIGSKADENTKKNKGSKKSKVKTKQ